jgi:hypothetical protein
MILRDGSWGELEPGRYIADHAGHVWRINAEQSGWFQLVDAQGVTAVVQRLAPATPVKVFDLTEQEAIDLLGRVLGAVPLHDP